MKCYLCGCSDFTLRPGRVRNNSSLSVMECKNCSLVFLNDFNHIKENHYENGAMHENHGDYLSEWLRASQNDDNSRFNEHKANLLNKTVLDFGCGAGGFITMASEVSEIAVGVDLDKKSLIQPNNKVNFFSSVDEVDAKFDVVTAFHVIEHLKDPITILNKLRKKLSKDGVLIVEVPSSNDALLTLYNNDEFQKYTYWSNHLFLYNRHTLSLCAERAGFKNVTIINKQRYPLSNHLYWLSNGLPGGHIRWAFLDSKELSNVYEAQLSKLDLTDTIVGYFYK